MDGTPSAAVRSGDAVKRRVGGYQRGFGATGAWNALSRHFRGITSVDHTKNLWHDQ